MSLEKMHPALKEQFCEQLYERHIVGSSEKLMKYEEYAHAIKARMPVSCYTNFRDALFHFRKVVSSMEESEIERQAFAVKEHLSRALTDAGSSILYHLSDVAEVLLGDEEITADVQEQIRKCLHNLKSANLRKRFGGMMISNDDMSRISHEEIQGLIDDFYKLLDEKCADKFARYSNGFSNNIVDA